MTDSSDILKRAAHVAAMVSAIERSTGTTYEASDLSISSVMLTSNDGVTLGWKAHMGSFTTHPRSYESPEAAVAALEHLVSKAKKARKNDE